MLRIKAILLLVLFSFSALGNTFEIHYCEGEVTDIALFGSADCVCENEAAFVVEETCHGAHTACCGSKLKTEQERSLEKKSCCESEFATVIKTSEFQHMPKSTQQVWGILLILNPSVFLEQTVEFNTEFTYIAPESWVDIPIKLQRFLI